MKRFYQLEAINARWLALAQRERMALSGLAWGLGLLLVWLVLLAPALRTVREAPVAQARLGSAMEQMQALQTRARALQARPEVSPTQWLNQLRERVRSLGAGASVQQQGDQITVILKQVNADTLSAWLATDGVRLQPEAMQLDRDPGSLATWSGNLVFVLSDVGAGR
jgi:general secretion pathway protein M